MDRICGQPSEQKVYLEKLSALSRKLTITSAAVKHQGSLTEPIQVKSRVRQGCLLSPIIFLSVMDEVMRKVIGNHRRGITRSLQVQLEDLEYATNQSK
jgi:hypothetical protein